jgi:crossover junction endodeoxyribonuclease RusA
MLSAAERTVPLAFHGVMFDVAGVVVPKGRPRLGKGHVYTPEKTRAYEQLVAMSFLRARPRGWTKVGDFDVTLHVHLTSRRSQPDVDNCIKSVLDGMNGIAYADDGQVVSVAARLVFGAATPLVRVTVTRL